MPVNPYQAKINRIIKKVFRWLLRALLIAIALWLGFLLTGKILCRSAIKQIAELTGTNIKTESLRFHTNGSVLIKNLTITSHKKQTSADFVLKANTVSGQFSIASLLSFRPRLKQISAGDFVFNAQYNLDTGLWNLSGFTLKVPKGGAGKMPFILLEDGTLQYSKISNGQVKVAAQMPLNAKFGPTQQPPDSYAFEIATAKMAVSSAKSRLTGFWKPGLITFAGGVSSTDLPALEMSWVIDYLAGQFQYGRDGDFSLKLRIKDFQAKHSPPLDRFTLVGPSFLEKSSPFAALQRFFTRYQPSGQIDLDLDASGNLNRPNESSLSGKVLCKDVSVCYYDFPYKIEHLTGPIDLTADSATFNNLLGNHGSVKLSIGGWTRDFGPNLKYQLRITSDNISLDKDLYSALGTNQKKLWDSFSPQGRSAVDYQLTRNSQTDKRKILTVTLLNTDALYDKFPYPLKKLTGNLIFDGSTTVISNVVSTANLQKFIINGKVLTGVSDKPVYNIQIDVNNVPLDSTLKRALPDAQKNLCDQFGITGQVDGRINISAPEPNTGPINYTADLSFKNASLKSERFPAPITEISANAVLTPDSINLKSFSGRYNEIPISLTGQIHPDPQNRQHSYDLSITLQQAQLNDDLFALMPASLKKIVSELQPDGKINLIAQLNKAAPAAQPDYNITIECLGDTINFKCFPYLLKDLTGALIIKPDTVELQDITAAPASPVLPPKDSSPRIKLNGRIAFADNNFDSASLKLLAQDISFNERLGAALPQTLQSLYLNLSPSGKFDINLPDIKVTRAQDGKKHIDLSGSVKLNGCTLNISAATVQLHALLTATASYKTGLGLTDSHATLLADTITILDKSMTGFKADVHYDPNLHTWSAKNLFADCYNGKVTGAFELKHPAGAAPQYSLQLAFDNIDLKQFLSATSQPQAAGNESQPASQEPRATTGKMSGELSLGASTADTSSRIGICRLSITDMQAGHLSPLGKLLHVLNLTEPKDFAFNRMFLDSYIKNDRLIFRKLDLSGDALAFYGSGWMNIPQHNVDLVLIARGRRLATADPSIFESLTEGIGRAVVRMEVTGDLYDPKITTKALPLIEESLEILGTRPLAP
jgi:hypothetical protein